MIKSWARLSGESYKTKSHNQLSARAESGCATSGSQISLHDLYIKSLSFSLFLFMSQNMLQMQLLRSATRLGRKTHSHVARKFSASSARRAEVELTIGGRTHILLNGYAKLA